VIGNRYLQVWNVDLAFEFRCRWYSDMVEFHGFAPGDRKASFYGRWSL
jgi:hypothetical protein